MPGNSNLFLKRVKSECIIIDYLGIMDMDFVPTQSINGCTWTVADLCFPKLVNKFYSSHLRIIDTIMYCDFNTAVVIAANVKGWHLPTLQECEKLVMALNKNGCSYKISSYMSTQFHKYRIPNYGHEMYHFGNDCNFNAQFNGYIWNGNHRTNEELNKHWTNESSSRYMATAMWFKGGVVPNMSEVFKECDKEAQYPLRLIKDEAG